MQAVENSPVYVVRSDDYAAGLEAALARLWQLNGWLNDTSLKGKRVLIKPNMLTDRTPQQAVTTHPEFLRQVIRVLKSQGAAITVGDSPASIANLAKVWHSTGLGAVCAAEDVPLIALEEAGAQTFNIDGFSFPIARPVLEADLLINLPKVKSHSLTLLTAAVKNIYGTIPGYAKTILHRRYPKPKLFGQLVQTLWRVMPPSWNLADGIIGMQGQGPANGTPIQLGFIAASHSPFNLDRVLCDILGINAQHVPYLSTALGAQPTSPPLIGDTIRIKAFKIPSGGHALNFLPEWLIRRAAHIVWVRPRFSSDKCRRCNLCVQACPVTALSLRAGQAVPQLQNSLCISCSCCHEVCPHDAIRMAPSPVLKALKVFKGLS